LAIPGAKGKEVQMKQSRERKTVVALAKKRVMRSNEMTAGIPEGLASQKKTNKNGNKRRRSNNGNDTRFCRF
jgi:hypothetical protein